MDKQLHEFTKEELISIIQDYQEMVSDIEEELNSNLDASEKGFEKMRRNIRTAMDKYLYISEQATECDDCGIKTTDLITKGDHHGGMKTVCTDRNACHARGG